ncbi:hypothetical protein SAMN05444487_1022 [Marininema mesophilum]|uniref:Membrane domain of glycerophosphoryl diester phosphodiesterase n=1 Tax=Marininema mesophilum TaxID=1048340 RepID=A0A1H2RSY9_9BACL|nr:hypothetical protein [Marininema mesophilum]SDW22388.1 hypothetical protein SAMN05444487_1022 [Marininema mesophilum]
MQESLRLFNRFGMKCWLSSLAGGLIAMILLLIPHLFIGAMIKANWATTKEVFKHWATSLTVLPFDQLIQPLSLFNKGGALLIGYTLLAGGLTFLVGTFYLAGLTATARDAVVNKHVMVSRFFSEGLRKTFPLFGLLICHIFMTGIFFTIVGAFVFLTGRGMGVLITVGVIGGLLYLLLLIIKTYSLIILFSEDIGVIRSLSYSFKSLFRLFIPTLTTYLITLFTTILGMVVIGALILFPWFILQFFKDGTVALIVGVILGGVASILLASLPIILALIVLFDRYIKMIQPDLFPEDSLQATLLRPTSF